MTVQEALKDIIESGIEMGAGDYVDIEALKVAVECMEKQIPKKPIKNNPIINNFWSEDSMLCPICHNYVGTLFRDTYCCYCGQMLTKEGVTSD
jgi:hypothetical protein